MYNKVIQGDCAAVLSSFPEECIDLTCTSPPYDSARLYKGFVFDFEAIAQQLFKVTKKGGVVVWVVGDQTINGSESGTSFRQALYFKEIGFNLHDTMIYEKNGPAYPASFRSNRYSQVFEYMFILAKGKPKTYNLIKDKPNKWAGHQSFGRATSRQVDGSLKERGKHITQDVGYRYNIWKYNTGFGYSSADKRAFKHPAIFPDKLAEDHIITWSNEGDVVLDPMSGSGTVLIAAKKLNRKYIGIEISGEYCSLINERLKNP